MEQSFPRPFGIALVLGLISVSVAAGVVLAEEQNPLDLATAESLEEQLRAVKVRIEQEQRQLRELKKSEEDVERQLSRLAAEQSSVDAKQATLKKELSGLDERTQQLEAELSKNVNSFEELKQLFRQRTVANYKMLNEAAGIDYLVSASSPTDLLRRTVYLSRISRQDEVGIARMREQIALIQEQRSELGTLKEKRSSQLAALDALEKQLQRNEEEKRALLERKQAESRGHERALRSFSRTEQTLETMIEVLTGGEPPQELPVETPTAVPATVSLPPEPPPLSVKILNPPQPFLGAGLESLKGNLLFPASGRMVQGFGMVRHQEFSDVLFHKGVEMEIRPGTPVQAIAAGRVVVEQDLPGIGLTVILDHGSRYYSLYGRLRVASHRRGDEVKRGQEIGQVGPSDSQGRNFYFELRYRGKAINPNAFFKDLPSS